MTEDIPAESVAPTLSGPDAPKFPPTSPAIVVDLALIESLNLSNAEELERAKARSAEIIADAEARAAKLIAAAVADAEEQVAEVGPRAEAEAAKLLQEARDEAANLEAEASEKVTEAEEAAERLIADARERAADIVAEAEARVKEVRKTIEIDRDLATERLAALEAREVALEHTEAEAERVLENARAEADRMLDEAGATVDRLMRSGQNAADAQRESARGEERTIAAMQSQHNTELRELTESYEHKLSNQNIENLELRQEIERLRERLETVIDGAPAGTPPTPAAADSTGDDGDEADAAEATSPITDVEDDFVSPWRVPDEPDDSPDFIDLDIEAVDADAVSVGGGDEAGEADDADEPSERDAPAVGRSTGLAPNARLVEPLEASVFRAKNDEDGKKRRSRRSR